MKTLIFDLSGPFAHFRKFYTNSSSLSYSIPPRSVLAGLIAAVLGMERDSYYEIFSEEKLKVGIRLNRPVRKVLQSLNYIKVEITSPKDLIAFKKHTQIPFEMLTADEGVSYRIYVSMPYDKGIFDQLVERIKTHRYYFTPYLGSASFQAHLEFIEITEAISFLSQNFFDCISPVRIDMLSEKGIKLTSSYSLVREKMPVSFKKDRNIQNVKAYLIEEKGLPIKIITKVPAWKMCYKGIEENILFL